MNIDESQQMQEDQNKTRTVAAGFDEDTTEQEIKDLLTSSIIETGMSPEFRCPAKPITHAFLQFIDIDERDKYIRSAIYRGCHQVQLEQETQDQRGSQSIGRRNTFQFKVNWWSEHVAVDLSNTTKFKTLSWLLKSS